MGARQSSSTSELEHGRRIGQEEERALMARKLYRGFECLTAASFAVDLAKEQSELQGELVLKASKLLDEAVPMRREKSRRTLPG
jgi:hypothetical protein